MYKDVIPAEFHEDKYMAIDKWTFVLGKCNNYSSFEVRENMEVSKWSIIEYFCVFPT
jgi:hypothetical protein